MNDTAPFSGNDDYRIGETRGEHAVHSVVEARDAALALAQQARYSLRIFSRDLDAAIYSTESFRDAVSALARAAPQTEVRILVRDPAPAIHHHHHLIGLIQTLSSHIGVRRIAEDWRQESCAFLLADQRALLWRPNGDRFEGSVDFTAGGRARELGQWFDHVWENSRPDPEFRHLRI